MNDVTKECIARKLTREKDYVLKNQYWLRQYLAEKITREEYLYPIDCMALQAQHDLSPIEHAWIVKETAWREAEEQVASA
jgi:hypothetical protein